jgi:hypothetical protein
LKNCERIDAFAFSVIESICGSNRSGEEGTFECFAARIKRRKALYKRKKRMFEQKAVSSIFGAFNDAVEKIVAHHIVERRGSDGMSFRWIEYSRWSPKIERESRRLSVRVY